MQLEVTDAEVKFMEEHRDEIEAAQRWEQEQQEKVDDEYGEEVDASREESEATARPTEKPEVPIFNKDEFLKKWLEDNPVIDIPKE